MKNFLNPTLKYGVGSGIARPDRLPSLMCCLFPCRHAIGSDRVCAWDHWREAFIQLRTSTQSTFFCIDFNWKGTHDARDTHLERRETSYFMCKNIRNYYMKVDHSILLRTKPNLYTWFARGRFKICQKLHVIKVGFVHMNFTLQKIQIC